VYLDLICRFRYRYSRIVYNESKHSRFGEGFVLLLSQLGNGTITIISMHSLSLAERRRDQRVQCPSEVFAITVVVPPHLV